MTESWPGPILVTGATGFVGQALCRELHSQGIPVVRALRHEAEARAGCQDVVVGDIGPDTNWRRALAGVSTVVHLAAHVHQINASPLDDSPYHRVNTQGTLVLAHQAQATGVGHFVFMSSVKVHGERTTREQPFDETQPPAPSEAYARSKWMAEEQLTKLTRERNWCLTVLRPPLIYGPGVGANFRALLRLAASGLPLPLGTVRNLRSLVYVDNLVSAVLAVAQTPPAGVRTYLVSDQEDLSTPDLIGRMRAAVGMSPRLLPCPVPLLHGLGRMLGATAKMERLTESLRVDARKITTETGWRPPFDVTQALALTCRWYLAHRANPQTTPSVTAGSGSSGS